MAKKEECSNLKSLIGETIEMKFYTGNPIVGKFISDEKDYIILLPDKYEDAKPVIFFKHNIVSLRKWYIAKAQASSFRVI